MQQHPNPKHPHHPPMDVPLSGMSSTRRSLMLSALATLCLSACGRKSDDPQTPAVSFNGVDITGAEYARQMAMPDVDGKVRTLAEFKGKVVFLFFGFTQCPDVCPTTMAELAEVRRQLGEDGQRVQGIFVTVDPERDTPEVLKAYLHGMDPSFIGLRGTLEQTAEMGREFKVFYQKVPTKGEGYTMDHTAGAYVFDSDGQVRLFVRYGMPVDQLTSDIRHLLGTGGKVAATSKG